MIWVARRSRSHFRQPRDHVGMTLTGARNTLSRSTTLGGFGRPGALTTSSAAALTIHCEDQGLLAQSCL
jgi:hypothetical protein